jgi:hypothetical protein
MPPDDVRCRTAQTAGREAGVTTMDEFELSRIGAWTAVIAISFGIWAAIIGGLALL